MGGGMPPHSPRDRISYPTPLDPATTPNLAGLPPNHPFHPQAVQLVYLDQAGRARGFAPLPPQSDVLRPMSPNTQATWNRHHPW